MANLLKQSIIMKQNVIMKQTGYNWPSATVIVNDPFEISKIYPNTMRLKVVRVFVPWLIISTAQA